MERVLFHGSEKMIIEPSVRFENSHNDFGKGFYCTENIELAKEWACKEGNNGFANRYQMDMEGLSVCNLITDGYNILNWLALLTKYRSYWQKKSIAEQAKDYLQEKYLIDLTEYDVVIGYRADDSYFSFAQDFIMGNISLGKLANAMRLGKLGEQVVIRSEKAFDRLKYTGSEIALAQEYYLKKIQRDKQARKAYRDEKTMPDSIDDIFILDILRGRVNDDELCI